MKLSHRILRNIFLTLLTLSSWFFISTTIHAHADLQVLQSDRSRDEIKPHIVGGTKVPPDQRTFQVALLTGGQQVCGGAIIADRWVLTAAHCVDGINITQVLSGTQTLSKGGSYHSVSQIIRHPNWDAGLGTGNDIALIQIDGNFANALQRLKLADQNIMSSSASAGNQGIVSGWGYVRGNGPASDKLLQTTNTIISDAQCDQLAGDINGDSIICANDTNHSSCSGDSGGPFTIGSGEQIYSIGIVSFGPQSCVGFSAYTETANFVGWINQYVDTGTDSGNQDPELQNDNAVSVSGKLNEMKYYKFTLPDGISKYSVTIEGGSGDADLYVREGYRPTDLEYDCRPYMDGNTESCTKSSPAAGTYYVSVKGYRAFNNVSLVLSYAAGNGVATNTCPSGHKSYAGSIEADGSTILDDNYYHSVNAGIHSIMNLGEALSMRLFQWKSSWKVVESADTKISHQGSEGYYYIQLSGEPNAAYQVCVQTP